ncbi:MAG: PaaI family thioesterase [Polyangiales bacterium]
MSEDANEEDAPPAANVDVVVRKTLGLPSSAAGNLRVVESGEGEVVCRLDVTEALCANTGALSGGELYGILDSVAYLSILTVLSEQEAAVSHDAHFSLMSMAPLGSEVEIHAKVQRRGRSVAFIRVDAFVLGDDTRKPLALATITKSIIPMNVRLRHRSSA